MTLKRMEFSPFPLPNYFSKNLDIKHLDLFSEQG